MGQGLIDKQMTRSAADGFQNVCVGQAFIVKPLDQPLTGTLRGHADPGNTVTHCANQLLISGSCALCVKSICNGVIDT